MNNNHIHHIYSNPSPNFNIFPNLNLKTKTNPNYHPNHDILTLI